LHHVFDLQLLIVFYSSKLFFMKTFCLVALIAVSLLFFPTSMHGQTTTSSLDHLKLANAFFVGTWQASAGKDTIDAWECQQYGKAFIINVFNVINGKRSFLYVMNIAYSSKDNKLRGFILYQSGIYMTWIGSFTSERKCIGDYVRNFNPEAVVGKFEIILETPTDLTVNNFNLDGVKTGEYKWSKVK
jgi:hypothetical protein